MIITLATSQNLQNKKHWIRLNTSQWPNGKATQLGPLLLGLLHWIQLLEAFTLRELVIYWWGQHVCEALFLVACNKIKSALKMSKSDRMHYTV
jgi:hypothetical protein